MNRILFSLLLGAMSIGWTLAPGGISTPFADVQVQDVPLGKPFAIVHSAASGLSLQNLGSEPVNIQVDVLVPNAADLRDGAEAIPEITWIQIEPKNLMIPAHGRALCRVVLKVPNEKSFRSKYYQAMIWSHAESPKGKNVSISAGLISRLRFRTK